MSNFHRRSAPIAPEACFSAAFFRNSLFSKETGSYLTAHTTIQVIERTQFSPKSPLGRGRNTSFTENFHFVDILNIRNLKLCRGRGWID